MVFFGPLAIHMGVLVYKRVFLYLMKGCLELVEDVPEFRDHGWSYDRQVRSDVFGHADVTCFYLTANKTAYIYITKAFDQSEPRNRL